MKDFIQSQIRRITRTPNVRMPRPAQCLLVTRLATPSVASEAGIAPKDFLVSLDSVPASDVSPDTYRVRARAREWVFYSRARHELVTLEATGIEPGILLQPTPDGLKERYNPKTSSAADLDILWQARDFKGLEDLSRKTLSQLERVHPALAYLGAALYETGRKDEGMALVREYVENFAPHWTMNFTGVGYSYLALDLLARGDQEAGIGMLYTAFEYHSCSRLADLVEKHTGVRPALEANVWTGRVFPDYTFPRLGGSSGRVSLASALSNLGEGQLLAVCLLASYRGNGPYNEFMSRYLNFATWFAPYLKGLHVITMESERPAERPFYFAAEDSVLAAKLPLDLLLEDGSLSAAVRQTSSPFIVLLDRGALVRFEGDLDSVDLWSALGALQAH